MPNRLSLTRRQARIIEAVAAEGKITRAEAARLNGVSIRTASRDLARLVDLGRLVPDDKTGNAAGYVLL